MTTAACAVRRVVGPVWLLAAIVSLAGCDLVMSDFSSQARDEWSRSYTLAAGGRVEVINVNGRIEVQPTAGETVEVRADKVGRAATEEGAKAALGRIEIVERVTEQLVRLETRTTGSGFHMGGAEVRYFVRVPAGVEVNVRTVNGAVALERLAGEVTAATTNGSIKGDDLGGRVTASTTNGGIDIALARVPAGGVTLETTNGSIELQVPRDAAATISARLANGRIDASGLAVEIDGEASRRRLDGRLNGGGERLRLETTNGSIRIRGKTSSDE